MSNEATGGSRLLGELLVQLRGERSREELAAVSVKPPWAARIRKLSVDDLESLEEGRRLPDLHELWALEALYEVPLQRFLERVKLDEHAELTPDTEDFTEALEAGYQAVEVGDYPRAEACFRSAEELATDAESRATATNNKAGALWKMGMLFEAGQEYSELLAIINLPPGLQVKCLRNLAEVLLARGHLPSARLHAEAALDIAQQLEMHRSIGHVHETLANVLDAHHGLLEHPDDSYLHAALEHHEQALGIFEQLGYTADAALTRVNLGSIYCRLGNVIVGLKNLREGLAGCEADGNDRDVALAMKELGRAYFLTRNYQKAKDYLYDCEKVAERRGYHDQVFNCNYYLWEIELAQGGRGHHELRRLKRLRPFLEGTTWERQQFELRMKEIAAEKKA
ncbi:MAG: tetratricopeptide repeat protein [Acidobacteriota bacterium]